MRELDVKSFGPLEIKDEEKGEVSAIVATLEVVDRDGDVILPGAIPMGGAKVKLSGYGHDIILQDAPPVGIGTISEEAGKAVFDGRFFLSTERGREAFATVKELGTDGEWSFGFPNATVKTSKVTDDWKEKGARRLIKSLEPVEASPVFRGAGRGTMTMHVKAMKASDDSLTDRISAVNDALYAYNEALPEGERDRYWWGREVFEDYVIVEAGTQLLRIEYTVDEEGAVTLGAAVEVEIVYQPVEEKATEEAEETKSEETATEEDGEDEQQGEAPPGSAAEPEEEEAQETKGEELELDLDGGGDAGGTEEATEEEPSEEDRMKAERALKAKTLAAVEEYERVQRTLRKLRVV